MDGMNDATSPEAPAKPAPTPEEIAAEKLARRNSYYGIRPGTKGSGTPDVFGEDAKPPVFHFEVMTATDSQAFADRFYKDYRLERDQYDPAAEWLLNRKLLPWVGYVDPDGVPYAFEVSGEGEARKLSPACYATIPIPLRFDLMRMILNRNAISPKETQGVKS